jgi:hypothetical protein
MQGSCSPPHSSNLTGEGHSRAGHPSSVAWPVSGQEFTPGGRQCIQAEAQKPCECACIRTVCRQPGGLAQGQLQSTTGRQRLRQVKSLAQSCIIGEWWRQDIDVCILALQSLPLTIAQTSPLSPLRVLTLVFFFFFCNTGV